MTATIEVDADLFDSIDEIEDFAASIRFWTMPIVLDEFEMWGQELTEIGARLSPRDKLRGVDPRRNEKPFYLQWRHEKERESDTQARLSVGNTDPRMPFIIRDGSARQIPRGGAAAQRRKGFPMRFFWQRGPGGPGFYVAWEIKGGAAQGTTGAETREETITRTMIVFDIDVQISGLALKIQDKILEELPT